jgi:hypothetical protein
MNIQIFIFNGAAAVFWATLLTEELEELQKFCGIMEIFLIIGGMEIEEVKDTVVRDC